MRRGPLSHTFRNDKCFLRDEPRNLNRNCCNQAFYYFRLEDQVPETHLLRLIEKHISFAFVRERLKQSYSETGRPSIDPELLLRILLIGYL